MADFSLDSLKELSEERDFALGDTVFTITKIGAIEGYRIFESIRHELSKVDVPLAAIDTKQEAAAHAFQSILGLRPEFIEKIRQQLFKHVRFRNNRAKSPLTLLGSEDMAMDGLEPIEVYNVLVRCLAVNFFPSFAVLASRLKVNPKAADDQNGTS